MGNHAKSKQHRREVTQHREMVYEAVLDKVIEGKQSPEYLHERWLKLKQVKKER